METRAETIDRLIKSATDAGFPAVIEDRAVLARVGAILRRAQEKKAAKHDDAA